MGGSDIVLSPQTVVVVGGLLSSMSLAIVALSGAVAYLYRQILKERTALLDERNRVLEERNARMVDHWREMEEKEIRIVALEASNERLQKLAADATAGWRQSIEEETSRRA